MKFPTHIAIVMDGNRRWSQLRGLPALEGHKAGLKSMRSTMEYLSNYGLKYLTVYGFSTENWNRSPDEVEGLFHLFTEVLNKETSELNKRGVRLRHLGRFDELPPDVKFAINRAVELTKDNSGMTLNFAVNYGGRQEIVDAVRQLVDGIINAREEDGKGEPPELYVDEAAITRYLYTGGMPDVDLLIRTGGDLRLSNFLIWQTAYSEYYFTPVLWPDFSVEELERALLAYSQRKRRFGGD